MREINERTNRPYPSLIPAALVICGVILMLAWACAQ